MTKRLYDAALRLGWLCLAVIALSACSTLPHSPRFDQTPKIGSNPPLILTLAPTETPTETAGLAAQPAESATASPTPSPSPTATVWPTATPTQSGVTRTVTPTATATPRPTRARPTPTPTPRPTPVVVIPAGFTKQTDSVRGYSLALPRGYTLLDLRSAQFRNLANAVGMGDRMATLNQFLDSPAGQSIGILAASDLAGMIFGGLPTIAQVMVVEAPGASQETAQVSVEALLSGQGGFLSNPEIQTMESVTINNLPAVRATVTGQLAGSNRAMAGKVVGLLANDKFFVLIQLTEASKWSAKEAVFDQIIGAFRPE